MIFLDVGAHEGQTLVEVRKDVYDFDRIYSFEPMPVQYARLVADHGHDSRVTLLNYGLADCTGSRSLYGDNERMEASLYPEKNDVDVDVVTPAEFMAASEFFVAFVPDGCGVVVKLNCEGAEVVILNDLIDSGEVHKITNVLIDFDIRKVEGHEHEEAEVLARLAAVGFDRYCLAAEVMVGVTHQDRIANWLQTTGLWPTEPSRASGSGSERPKLGCGGPTPPAGATS